MAGKDPRVDAYIRSANDFAKPILKELRKRVHASVPQVEESIRWGAPTFLYRGKLLAGMGAFKAHCVFGFWHPLMRDGDNSLEGRNGLGRLESLADLPSAATLAKLAKKAAKLVDEGVKPPAKPKVARAALVIPKDFAAALAASRKAVATFEAFPYSARKEYVEWIAEAKRDETRAQRIATSVEWLAQGKRRHWKYQAR